ncbi:MAG: hypothetical protein N3E42_00040 [Candidatus Bipolaricaulota bacterium]|nr:hypothetical protein [Candidatus Bipolaricaulota bacterium]
MRKRIVLLSIIALGTLSALGALAQSKVDLLLVDETQTLQASLMVQIYARALQESGLFNFEAKIVRVASSYDDPLGVNPTDKRYELIVIVPRGIEDGSVPQIWLITKPIGPQTRPELLTAIELIRQRVAQGSGGLFKALTVLDDGALGIFSSVFERHGWLK